MKQRLIIRPEAEVDITSAVVLYEEHERGLGSQLLAEIRTAINRVLAAPDAYLQLRSRPAVHRILVRRFLTASSISHDQMHWLFSRSYM